MSVLDCRLNNFQFCRLDILYSKTKFNLYTRYLSANSGVRDAVSDYCRRRELKAFIPPRLFTTDNAAMVAIAGYYKYIDRIFCRYDQVPYARVGV